MLKIDSMLGALVEVVLMAASRISLGEEPWLPESALNASAMDLPGGCAGASLARESSSGARIWSLLALPPLTTTATTT